MVTPIAFGDVVGLTDGSGARVSDKGGKEYIQFKFSGGSGLIKNDQEVTLAPVTGAFPSLQAGDKWKLKIDQTSLYSGAQIKLEAAGKAAQQYHVHKLRIDPIEHVVVLMLENRSFFRVFGYMDPNRDNYVNYSLEGKAFYSEVTADRETPDPPHEIEYVDKTVAGGKPKGYVKAYQEYHNKHGTKIDDNDLKDVMGYTRKGFLPALHKMEEVGTICSRWYCSMAGPTWPNRMFVISGTSFNWRTTPEMNFAALGSLTGFLTDWYAYRPPAPQRGSIFEIFKEKDISYKVYSDTVGEFSLSWLFYPASVDADDMDDFYEDVKKGELPHFSFIEPNYLANKFLGWKQNDDHPPADPIDAQDFIASVYESLRNGPNWNKTLFIVTYDEHGGFFDPEVPPAAPVPDKVSEDKEGTFAKFGMRVPTVLVSPCVNKAIDNTVYDHTSILKYMLEKWAPESVGHLGERVKAANSLPVLPAPRDDALVPITANDISIGRSLRSYVKPSKTPEPVVTAAPKKPTLAESANIALKDAGVTQQLKALLVEKSLVSSNTKEELAEIAVAGLSLGGVANVGSVTLGTAVAAAGSVATAEKHADEILGKCTLSVSQLIGKATKRSVSAAAALVLGKPLASSAKEAEEVVASQLRATALLTEKVVGDNKLAQLVLLGLKEKADEVAKNMIRKGKEV